MEDYANKNSRFCCLFFCLKSYAYTWRRSDCSDRGRMLTSWSVWWIQPCKPKVCKDLHPFNSHFFGSPVASPGTCLPGSSRWSFRGQLLNLQAGPHTSSFRIWSFIPLFSVFTQYKIVWLIKKRHLYFKFYLNHIKVLTVPLHKNSPGKGKLIVLKDRHTWMQRAYTNMALAPTSQLWRFTKTKTKWENVL